MRAEMKAGNTLSQVGRNWSAKNWIGLIGFSLIVLFVTISSVLADPAVPAGGAPAGAPAAQPPGVGGMLVPFVAMFAVMYFLMIRPQQKKAKQQLEMLNSLKHGDEVLTSSGILGKVTGITDKVVTVEIADDVRVKMLKSQVTTVIKGPVTDKLA